jgi:hypothetical protein
MASSKRDIIAYHEAGHAIVGLCQGLRFSRIYIGDASGQVVFDTQWGEDEVLQDRDTLDRYALMLLAGAAAEWRHSDTVQGATGDIAALCWLVSRARERGTAPRPDRWRRTTAEVAHHWGVIEALADELDHHSTPVADPRMILLQYPHLGTIVKELTGEQSERCWPKASRRPHPRLGPLGENGQSGDSSMPIDSLAS